MISGAQDSFYGFIRENKIYITFIFRNRFLTFKKQKMVLSELVNCGTDDFQDFISLILESVHFEAWKWNQNNKQKYENKTEKYWENEIAKFKNSTVGLSRSEQLDLLAKHNNILIGLITGFPFGQGKLELHGILPDIIDGSDDERFIILYENALIEIPEYSLVRPKCILTHQKLKNVIRKLNQRKIEFLQKTKHSCLSYKSSSDLSEKQKRMVNWVESQIENTNSTAADTKKYLTKIETDVTSEKRKLKRKRKRSLDESSDDSNKSKIIKSNQSNVHSNREDLKLEAVTKTDSPPVALKLEVPLIKVDSTPINPINQLSNKQLNKTTKQNKIIKKEKGKIKKNNSRKNKKSKILHQLTIQDFL
jgi:hypothetical protein